MNDIQRAIEELRYQEDMRGKGIPYQVDSLVIATAISAMQELQQYRQIGTLGQCDGYKNHSQHIQEFDALYLKKCQEVNDLRKRMQWIPVTWHETTEDDEMDMRKYPICLDCPMPEEDQEILVCGKNGKIWLDTCLFYDGYLLDSGNDWVYDILAWMPLPEPYRLEEQ